MYKVISPNIPYMVHVIISGVWGQFGESYDYVWTKLGNYFCFPNLNHCFDKGYKWKRTRVSNDNDMICHSKGGIIEPA